jgi:3-deoxy-D-manno-octulosonate 8-phosphate phosphatase (KDO 8-P phosphatase)
MTKRNAAAIRMLVLDVDGVMTDGRLHFGPRGEALKLFHVRDGLGIQQVTKVGIEVAVISGRKSKMVDVRCRELGVEHVYQGAKDKLAELERLCKRLDIPPSACACIGDDLPDIPVMRKVALAFAVADAHPEARHAAHLITRLPGGHGAVREVCDYLLAHGHAGRRTRAR